MVIIHADDCHYYLYRRRTGATVDWAGPFESPREAEEETEKVGKLWRYASCCMLAGSKGIMSDGEQRAAIRTRQDGREFSKSICAI